MKHVTTNSERTVWGRCRHLWLLSTGLGLAPLYEAVPLRFGRVWHACMDAWWASKEPQTRLRDTQQRARDLCAALFLQASTFSTSQPAGFSEDEAEHSLELLLSMLEGYEAAWAAEREDLHIIGTEVALSSRLKGPRGGLSREVYFGGTVDKIAHDRAGQVWILEHKTVGKTRPLSSWLQEHGYNPQAETYRALLDNRPVGVIYDLALKDLPPERGSLSLVKDRATKQLRLPARLPRHSTLPFIVSELRRLGEDPARHADRLSELEERSNPLFRREVIRFQRDEWSAERLAREMTIIGSEIRLARQGVSGARKLLLSWREKPGLEEQVSRLVSELAGSFPRSAAGCFLYGRPCDYLEVCRAPSPEGFLNFKVKEKDRESL